MQDCEIVQNLKLSLSYLNYNLSPVSQKQRTSFFKAKKYIHPTQKKLKDEMRLRPTIS